MDFYIHVSNFILQPTFLNIILSYNEWSIHIRYVDEPDAVYSYTVKNGQIKEAGVSGSVDKEDLKHKE